MFRVNLLQPEIDYTTRKVIARFEVNEGNYREFYDIADKEKEFDLSIKRHRNKRSLDANAYFHVLVGKIANKMEISKAEVKNKMLSLYGQLETDDNGKPVFMIVRENVEVDKWTEIHLYPTSQIRELNGCLYRVYAMIKGSHEYNSREMYLLIKGTISEARDAGLSDAEIMSPKEREMLKEVYGVKV